MNTHESYVSLETAELLKEVGFDWECNHAICCDSTHYPNLKEGDILEYNCLECSELMEEKKPHMLLCPTLDVAQRWLREVKNTHIEVSPNSVMSAYIYNILLSWDKFWLGSPTSYATYEEAQEAGIKKALEIILEKGKL